MITKKDLINEVALKTEQTKTVAESIINATLETIEEMLLKEEKIQISKFGIFETSMRAARTMKNIQDPTQTIEIPETRVVKFKPATALKEKIK